MDNHKTLTVKELIEELSQFDKDLPVYCFTSEGTCYLERGDFHVDIKRKHDPIDFPDKYLTLFAE